MKNVLMVSIVMLFTATVLHSQSDTAKARNVTSVGVMVGSGIIGADYEYRIGDNFGIQGGIGILGFDASLNFHFNNKVEGTYASLAYKSVGFGILNTIGTECGFRWMFGETKNWGIIVRIGAGKVLSVDKKFEKDYIKNQSIEKFPAVVLTYAIGVCF